MEHYILTRDLHFGHIKESFQRGTVIKFDPDELQLIIDGRKFDDYHDIDVLKRQAQKNPKSPWIIEYTDEAMQEINAEKVAEPEEPAPQRPSQGMEVVQSDEDDHSTKDISHTKISERNAQEKEAQQQRVREEGPEVIQGDEGVEERIERLQSEDRTNLSARAERVRLKGENKEAMPVVHDDSYGQVGDDKAAPLNAGSKVSGRRPDESDETSDAQAYKKDVEKRRAAAHEAGVNPDNENVEVTPAPDSPSKQSEPEPETAPTPSEDSPEETQQQYIERLERQLAEAKGEEGGGQ